MKQTLQKVKAPATRKPAEKNLDQKQARQPTKRKKEVPVEKKTPKSADMVTLTKSEFDAILETIGKLTMDSGNHSALKVGSHDVENQQAVERNNGIHFERREKSFLSNANDNHHHHQQNLPPETENPEYGIPNGRLTLADRKRLEWQKENDSVATGWFNRNEGQRAMTDPRPTRDQRQAHGNARLEELNVDNAPLFLTAAEKKKLQWEKERAELSALEKYDPWGRAGGGAPIKDQFGNVVNDYTKRQEVLLMGSSNQPWTQTASDFKTVDPSAYPSRNPPLQKAQSQPDRIDAVFSGAPAPNVAMMSSFRSGAIAPDESRFVSEKDRLKQEWLDDLEKQREEQRQRKVTEKKGRREEVPERYYWAERNGFANTLDERQRHPPQPGALESHGATHWDDPSAGGQMDLDLNESRNRHSAPLLNGNGRDAANAPPQNPYSGEGNSTYLLGQNHFVDPITRQEQEVKRRKYLETQEFNRRQYEERQQQRREEKERRIREDLEEEMKFNQTKQATNPNNASALPKPMVKEAPVLDKEEHERRREETLRHALEEARLEAEREKKRRLIEKLRKGNHDVSHLEAKLTSHRGAADVANATHQPFQEGSRPPNAGLSAHVEPQFVPGLGETGPNSGPSQLNSYRKTYKDVPADFTQTMREFGTQTGLVF